MVTHGGEPPAGWYPDPTNPNTQRYWDGERWTEHVQPLVDGQPPPPTQRYEAPVPAAPVSAAAPGPPAPAPWPPGPGPQPQYAAPPAAAPKQGMSTAGKVLIVIGVLMVLLVGGCVSLVVVAADNVGDSIEETITEFEESSGTDQPATSPVPLEETASDSGGEPGSRQSPLPFDVPVDLQWSSFGDADDSVWTTTIGPPRDITADVMAENQFNAGPPDGVVFVGFDVELTLLQAGKEPLAPAFNFGWELLGGASAAAYEIGTIETESFGCGAVPNAFDDFAEVFVSGTLSGVVCIPLPAADFGHPDTQVSLHFINDTRVVFGS